jgi:hypothetical protein
VHKPSQIPAVAAWDFLLGMGFSEKHTGAGMAS